MPCAVQSRLSRAGKTGVSFPAVFCEATTKQHELTRQAQALKEEWIGEVGEGRVSAGAAARVVERARERAAQLAAQLARAEIGVEQHNDQRFVMVMAMRRLIDGGGEERALRAISREMHDLFVDSPPLPHPKYRFTFDWVSPHAEAWRRDLAHLKDKPGVRGLEIGCFEGQSACWFLDNVLTHPTSRLTCVDPFSIPMDSVLLRYFEGYFDHNVAASGAGDRVFKLVGSSLVVLRSLSPAQFDFVYVDGSHRVGDVLQDAVLAWTLLRAGGIAIFDDYDLVDDVAAGLFARAPGRALDPFVSILGASAKVMRSDWQLVLKKT
jgi:predicted O-methyltransferase YrrM